MASKGPTSTFRQRRHSTVLEFERRQREVESAKQMNRELALAAVSNVYTSLTSLRSGERFLTALERVSAPWIGASTEKSFLTSVQPAKLAELEDYLAQCLEECRESGDEPTVKHFAELEAASAAWQGLVDNVPHAASLLAAIKRRFDRRVVRHVRQVESGLLERARMKLERQKHAHDAHSSAPAASDDTRASAPSIPDASRPQGARPVTRRPRATHDRRQSIVAASRRRPIPAALQASPRKKEEAPRGREATPCTNAMEGRGEAAPVLTHVVHTERSPDISLASSTLPSELLELLDDAVAEMQTRDMDLRKVYSTLTLCMNGLVRRIASSNRHTGEALLHLWALLLRLFDDVARIRGRECTQRAREEARLMRIYQDLQEGLRKTLSAHKHLIEHRRASLEAELSELESEDRVVAVKLENQRMQVRVLQRAIQDKERREKQLRRKTVTLMNRRMVRSVMRLADRAETQGTDPEHVQALLREELERHKKQQQDVLQVLDPFLPGNEVAGGLVAGQMVHGALLLDPKALEEALNLDPPKGTARERQREEAQRKEELRRKQIFEQATETIERSIGALDALGRELGQPEGTTTRDACVQASASDFEVRPVFGAMPKRIWTFVGGSKGRWVLRKNGEQLKVNPFVPAAFAEMLERVPVAYVPKAPPLRVLRKQTSQLFLQDRRARLERAGLSPPPLERSASRRLNNSMHRSASRTELPRMPSRTELPRMPSRAELPRMSSRAELPRMSSRAELPRMPSRQGSKLTDLAQAEPPERMPLTLAPSEQGVAFPFRIVLRKACQAKQDPENAECRMLDVLHGLNEMRGECTWLDTVARFLGLESGDASRVSEQGEAAAFGANAMVFFEASYAELCGLEEQHLVEDKESGRQYVTAQSFSDALPRMLRILTQPELDDIARGVLAEHGEEVRLSDRTHRLPKRAARVTAVLIPVDEALATALKLWSEAKQLMQVRLSALFIAADFRRDGILTLPRFGQAVRAANPDLSKHQVGHMYRLALAAGSNSETVQREDFVVAAQQFDLLAPAQWSGGRFGLPKYAKDDDMHDEEELSLQALEVKWVEQREGLRGRLDELRELARAGQLDGGFHIVSKHELQHQHIAWLIQRCSAPSRVSEQVMIEAGWMALWMLRFELEKVQRDRQVASALGSVQFLMRWKLRMRKLLNLGGAGSLHARIAKTERPKLHPIFSRCRWHRTEDFVRMLDEDFPIDDVDDCSNTLLHIAVQNGHDDFVQLLLERGADLDKQNMTGQTAMHFAKAYGHKRIFFMLRRAGANDKLVNKAGATCHEV